MNGNIKVGTIIQMMIDTLGTAMFIDTEFFKSFREEPEWRNFKRRMSNEKNVDLEKVHFVKKRLALIFKKLDKKIFNVKNEKDVSTKLETMTKKLHLAYFVKKTICFIIFGYFDALKANITNFLPCDLNQSEIAERTFIEHIRKCFDSHPSICRDEKLFTFFFHKNGESKCMLSLEKTNHEIKKAFKKAKKKLDDLKAIVDTDKGKKLAKSAMTWNVLKKLLNDELHIFDGIDEESVIQYKLNCFTFMILVNFQKAIKQFICEDKLFVIIQSLFYNKEDFDINTNLNEESPLSHRKCIDCFLRFSTLMPPPLLFSE